MSDQPETQPAAAQPETAQLKTAQLMTAQLKTAAAKTPALMTTQPETAQLRTTQPKATQLKTTQPKTTQPKTTQPKTTQPETGSKTRRVDAERNRARILVAAREVFGESGLLVPMSEIARRAEVGIATLIRNFSTREELIAATFEARIRTYADAIDLALADPDPWHGFCGYVETVCSMQATDRGFTYVLTMTFPNAKEFEAERSRAYRGFVRLTRRAQKAGGLRADFSPQDLPMLLMANAGVISATGDAAPDAWRRLVAYFLQACAAENQQPLPPTSGRQMYRALQQIGTTGP